MTVLAKSIKRFFHSSKRSESVFRAIAIAVILAMFLQLAMPVAKVSAEGSKETVANGGKRALTEWRTNTTAGFYRRTFFRVFANAGEYILMGSSAVGVNNGDIVLYRESQIANSQIAPATLSSITPTFTCSAYRTTHNGAGVLNTRAKELAGPASNAGGYTPCVYQATETGTYWVAMYGPDGASSAADGTAGTIDAPVVDNNQRSGVSMWDITVRSGNALTGTMKPGRVFVDYLAQISGSNGAAYQMYSTLYAATADGYVYQVDLNGLDPNGYIFYGNRVGFYDPDGKTPLYHDAVYPDNSLSVDAAYGGVLLASATAKIFFNNPLTSDLPVSILPTPVVPSINNVTFSGTASNNTSYYSQGGTFTYSGNVGGITEVIIQGNTSTDFEPDNPLNRRLLSESIVGSNSLSWDGKDNNGNYFPVRTDYPYKVIFHAGEYHFPLLDSENSVLGGPVLTLLNPFSGVCPFFSNCHGAFYDDRVYKVSTGAIVPSASYTVGSTLPGDSNSINPPATNHSDQSDGYDTSTAQRAYGSGGGTGFGNWKALDLWSYYPVDAISKTLNIVATTAQDLNITKTHSGNFSVGNNGGSFSIVVKNVGTTSIGNVDTQVTDTLPTGMTLYATPTGTNWSCSGAAGESSFTCTRASGSSHRNLAAGASFEPITVRVNVASSIAASVTNTATLTNTNDGNSANNSSSDTVNIARAELTISKTDSTAKKGLVNTPFNWEITALNTGELSAAFASGSVIFSDPLPANATYGTPLVTTSNVTNPGAINCTVAANTLTCTASGSTVTMLEADSRISVVLPTTPTVAGSFVNTATVDPNNGVVESNEANNTGSDTVTVYAPKLSVAKSSTTTAVTAVDQIIPYTFTVTNPGGVPLHNVVVSDAKCDVAPTLSSGDSNSDTILDVTETWLYTCNHTVTQTEFDAGAALSNTVTADSDETNPVTSTLDIPVIRLTVSKDASPTTIPETGALVTYTFTVTNQSSTALTISSLSDDKFGTLIGDDDCKLGTSLAVGASCDFTYATTLNGTANATHQNTFTAEGNDGSGHSATASDDATVTYTDVTPTISVSKEANPTSVPETGGDVTFTFTVTNSGTVPVTITLLTDSIFGPLSGGTGCAVNTVLAASGSCSFTQSEHLNGAAGSTHTNTFTAEAKDTENNKASDSDDATVTFTDVLPSIAVSKVADPTHVDETGANVTFTFTVSNDGTVPVTITSLSDSIFDTLLGDADCMVGTALAVGASCTFEETHTLNGSVSTPHVNTFTAEAEDAEHNVASDDADATVSFDNVLPSIAVTKTVNPLSIPETGGDVTFTFTVTNNGTVPVTITSLTDNVYGPLSGDADCQKDTELAAGGSCTFELTKTLRGSVSTPHQDTFTAEAEDTENNMASDSDDATVTFDDVLPSIRATKAAAPTSVPETGGDVTFTFTVSNNGTVPVTITSLEDDKFGPLTGDADCQKDTELAAGATCSFEEIKTLSGAAGTSHENTFTAQAEDAEGNDASDSDDATVTFNDVLPSISVTKSADPTSVDETGGNVTFTFTVNNTGTVPVTITSLEDDVFGTLDGDSDCQVGTELAASGSCSFELTRSLSGSAGSTHENTFTAEAVDAEENNCEDSDGAVVTFVDVLPSITVSKSANPTSMIYTGGDVTFTFTVNNNGTVPVTITSLEDDKFGTLTGDSDCQVGTELAAGASCSFEYSTHLSGDPETTHTNTFTAAVEDTDGNPTDASDTADVDFVGTAILGLAKELVSKTPVTSGNFDLTYQFVVKNYGTKDLTNIQIVEDLDAAFPVPTLYTVTSVLSSDLSVNADFDGSAHKDLLAGTDTLLSGESATITLLVNVTPAKAGPFNNTATVSGETSTGSEVSDDSQNGNDPDGPEEEHDGNPTNNNDPTPVTFDGTLYAPPVGIKSVDATAKPILTWSMVWVNNANKVPLLSVVHDPIAAKTTFVADPSLTGVGMPADAPTGSTMDGVSCSAGTSTSTVTTMCYYEGPTTENPRGQIVWAGVLGPDFGSTIPDTAENAIHIAFAVTVDTGTSYVKNVATIDADLNGDEDTADAGETKVANAVESWGTPPSTSNANAATEALVIPETGFAPGVNTLLPTQPLAEQYVALDSIWLEIPSLKLSVPIVGVPQKNGEWNITWLGNQAGWLNGTAFPTWAGNSVITGHVYDANGQPGVFANLAKLKFGDLIVIHAFGQQYVYEVREAKEVSPTDVAAVTRHEELPWITLVTCRGYDAATNSYESRYLVRAVQVKIK